jgi:hypothetical protein
MVGAVVPYTDPLGPGEAAESWRNAERWAMIRNPVPARTLNEVYSVVGQVLQTHANRAAHRLGLGPEAVAEKITSFFGTGEERQLRLIALWDEVPDKLERYCFKLMEYTLPCVQSYLLLHMRTCDSPIVPYKAPSRRQRSARPLSKSSLSPLASPGYDLSSCVQSASKTSQS